MKKSHYFEVAPLLKKYPHARYYYILGGRSTGKTYPTVRNAIKDAIKGKGLFAYIRRHKESLQEVFMSQIFGIHGDYVSELTNGNWNRVVYWRRRFWLELWETDEETNSYVKIARNPKPIGAAFSLSTWETDKGADFGFDDGVKNIIVDEVLSKAGQYLTDEWSIFQNVISTLVRDRWEFDTKIWLLANPISKWSNPYFRNMGIGKQLVNSHGITEIKYPNDKGGTAMSAVFVNLGEFAEVSENANKVHETFFAFPYSKGKSRSITNGVWEMEDSARLPSGIYKESTKCRTVYAIFGEEKLAIDIMRYDAQNKYYIIIYPVENIKEKTYFLILAPNLSKYAIVGRDDKHPIARYIFMILNTGQVYYSDDSTADAWHGFLIERTKYKI